MHDSYSSQEQLVPSSFEQNEDLLMPLRQFLNLMHTSFLQHRLLTMTTFSGSLELLELNVWPRAVLNLARAELLVDLRDGPSWTYARLCNSFL